MTTNQPIKIENSVCLTSTDPVKATLLMSMCSEMAAPAVGPKPLTILTTPAGKPALNIKKEGFFYAWN